MDKIAKVISCFVFLCISVLVNADNTGATSSAVKLKSVLKQITAVKTDIDQKEKQQTSVEQQLKNLKEKIKTLEASYQATIKNLKRQKNILIKINADQAKQQLKLRETRQKFFVQMKAAYQIDQLDYFKAVFEGDKENQLNPDLFLSYHRYIFVARLEQMHNIKKILERIGLNKQQIKKQTQVLEALESKQQQQKQELAQSQQEYNKILSSLKDKIAVQNQKLQQLISSKRNLERLIDRLSRTSPRQKIAISPKVMAQLCQKFVWPTKGTIAVHFGSPIEQSSWSWSGIIVLAPEKQGVRAISSGKVVYADWFAGYGLLLIIDHGSGYMSLYGHNHGFCKKLNDRVEAGEVVATVGKSGNDQSGLYFAIRYNGKPVNPEQWCNDFR